MNTIRIQKIRPAALALAVVGSALSLVLAAAPAHANDLTGQDVVVKYSAQAVATPVGATRLLAQLKTASSQVCAQPGSLVINQRCQQQVMDRAIAKVNQPLVTALYESSTGKFAVVADVTAR